MKMLFLTTFVALVLCFTSQKAEAVDQDMAKISCKDFLADKTNMPMMLMWIDGYISGKDDATTMSDAWIEKLGMHMGKFCAQNPEKTIIDAVEALPTVE